MWSENTHTEKPLNTTLKNLYLLVFFFTHTQGIKVTVKYQDVPHWETIPNAKARQLPRFSYNWSIISLWYTAHTLVIEVNDEVNDRGLCTVSQASSESNLALSASSFEKIPLCLFKVAAVLLWTSLQFCVCLSENSTRRIVVRKYDGVLRLIFRASEIYFVTKRMNSLNFKLFSINVRLFSHLPTVLFDYLLVVTPVVFHLT